MPTIAFVGDSHARSDILKDSKTLFDYTQGISALPVVDYECHKILKRVCSAYDYVFFSCSTELNGCKVYSKIKNLIDLSVEKRSMQFEMRERWWYKENVVHYLNKEHYSILNKIYFEQIEYYIQAYPNLILVPLTAKFLLLDSNTYSNLLTLYPNRCINLDNFTIEDCIDEYRHLSSTGYLKLKSLITKFINDYI